jgi:hypothetical protein
MLFVDVQSVACFFNSFFVNVKFEKKGKKTGFAWRPHLQFTLSLFWDTFFRILSVSTVCFIDLGKLNLIEISRSWSKLVKQTVEIGSFFKILSVSTVFDRFRQAKFA